MAIAKSGCTVAVSSIQKLSGTIPSQAYPQGSTIKTFAMPNFTVADPLNTVMQNVWWYVASGTLNQAISVCADVTGTNVVTVAVNNPGASVTLSLTLGGTVIEYG